MQILGKIPLLVLAFGIPFHSALAAEISWDRIGISDQACASATAGNAVGSATFTIIYDNTQAGAARVFNLEVLHDGETILNPQIQIPVAFPVYENGVLDLSKYTVGGLGGIITLKAEDACENGHPVSPSSLQIKLIPIR